MGDSGAASAAVAAVLGDPDLLERILAGLYMPRVPHRCRNYMAATRWTAAGVSRLWRRTALRLPLIVSLGGSAAATQALTVWGGRRHLQDLSLEVYTAPLAQCTAFLGAALALRSLNLTSSRVWTCGEVARCTGLTKLALELCLRPEVPQACSSALACLASLQGLRVLCLKLHRCADHSIGMAWVTTLRRLTELTLSTSPGVYLDWPGRDLPALAKLDLSEIRCPCVQLSALLGACASPQLSRIKLRAVFGTGATHPGALGAPATARAHLPLLQELQLVGCQGMDFDGLAVCAPCLTKLTLDDYQGTLSGALPPSVRVLGVYSLVPEHASLWETVFRATSLQFIGINNILAAEWPAFGAFLAAGLAPLPLLERVFIGMTIDTGESGSAHFEALFEQMCRRGGRAEVDVWLNSHHLLRLRRAAAGV